MLHITAEGKIYHPKVKPALRPGLASGDMKVIHGIVVHQTDSPTTLSTMNTYMKREKEGGTVGAHFLIDPDGTIYQTMSLLKRTDHVGPFLIPRCLVKGECEPFKLTEKISAAELKKKFPDRVPTSADSIGIEIVGQCLTAEGKRTTSNSQSCTYEPLTDKQQESLKWLIDELRLTFSVPFTEVYRHPQINWRKKATEAGTATW